MRNPIYDPATDDPSAPGNFDRFEIDVNTNVDNIFDKIERGELEGSSETPTARRDRAIPANETPENSLRINSGDRIWFLYMNLTHPAVRRRPRAQGDEPRHGPRGRPAGVGRSRPGRHRRPHLLPTDAPDSTTALLRRTRTPPFAGDVEAAKAEMKQSKYDTNKDGICDASACKGLVHRQPQLRPVVEAMTPIIEQSAKKIGIDRRDAGASRRQRVHHDPDAFAQGPDRSANAGWGKDYADPSTFMVLFDGRNILADRQQRVPAGRPHQGPGQEVRG